MDIRSILTRPIPDMSEARERRKTYRQYPLLPAHQDELVADVAEYGLAGQSYYSRPNAASEEPLPNVERRIFLRDSIAQQLAEINRALQASSDVTELLGGQVELYIDEGLRSIETQATLHDETFPALIHRQNPDLSPTEVAERRDTLVAEAPADDDTPSPHATGAAFDISFRYVRADLTHVPDAKLDMNAQQGSTTGVAQPDYFESQQPEDAIAKQAQINRRVFYWVMRGALNGTDSGFRVNPTEIWHWSYGDQMWACLTQAPNAFHGAIQAPNEV